MSRSRTDCEGFHRRDFLRVGAAGLLGLALPDVLRARPSAGGRRLRGRSATGVIQIWLSGGPATIDMWDPKPEAPEEIRGEFRPIATAAPGRLDLRAHAEAGEGHGPLRPGPVARPHDLGARAGHDLHGHGQPAQPGDRLSVAGIARGEGLAASTGPAALRDVRLAPGRGIRGRPGLRSARRAARSRSRATPIVGPSGPKASRSPTASRSATWRLAKSSWPASTAACGHRSRPTR